MKISQQHLLKRSLASLVFTGISFTAFSSSASAEDHPGQALHESANCMKCHSAQPYNPQKTTSFPRLIKAVTFCNENLNAGMFDDEIEQLADYLNETYYHHKK